LASYIASSASCLVRSTSPFLAQHAYPMLTLARTPRTLTRATVGLDPLDDEACIAV